MKYCIIGAGLIGGSLAKAIKAKDGATYISAVDSHPESLQLLQEEGAIDAGYTTLTAQAVAGADIIVIATPPHSWGEIARLLIPLVPSTIQLIMDVGSVKAYALECFGALPNFVPAHPIAGSEFSGAAFSTADLFTAKRVILTPTANTSPVAFALAERLWQDVGAQVLSLDAALHDTIYAYVSHLPQLVAFAVAQAWLPQGMPPTSDKVSPAFYRLCGSSPPLWAGIFAHNLYVKEAAEVYLRLLTHMIAELRTGVLSQEKAEITAIGLELSPRIVASCLISAATLAEKKIVQHTDVSSFRASPLGHDTESIGVIDSRFRGNDIVSMARYAGAGFADMTHPAMSDPAQDLVRISEHTNAVVGCLQAVEAALRALLLAITEQHWDALHPLLENAQHAYLHHF